MSCISPMFHNFSFYLILDVLLMTFKNSGLQIIRVRCSKMLTLLLDQMVSSIQIPVSVSRLSALLLMCHRHKAVQQQKEASFFHRYSETEFH